MGLSWQHLLLVLLVVLVLFGRGKISGIMKEFGEGMRGFKEGLKGEDARKIEKHPDKDERKD